MQVKLDVDFNLKLYEPAADFCSLAEAEAALLKGAFDSVLPVQQLLDAGKRSQGKDLGSVFYTWQEQCQLTLDDFQRAQQLASGQAAGILIALADEQPVISTQLRLFFNVDRNMPRRGTGAVQSRRLLARGGGAKGVSGGAKGRSFTAQQSQSANLGWTTVDQTIDSARIRGFVLPERIVGSQHEMIGGLLMHQVGLSAFGPSAARCR